MSREARVGAAAVGLLAVAAFAARLAWMAASTEPFGTDGYYYVVQVERFLATGRLHAPDGSWVLPLFAAVAAPFKNPVLGVKVGASFLAALCVPAAALAGRSLARLSGAADGGVRAGIALGAWAALSPTLGQLAAEFPKSLGVIPPALLTVALAAAPGRRGAAKVGDDPGGVSRAGRTRELALLGITALAASAAHRIGAALVALAVVGYGAGALSRRRGAGSGEALRLAGFAAALAVAFVAATLALPNLLHPADLERLRGQLRAAPGWPPPFGYLAIRPFHPLQALELSMPWAAVLAAVVAWVRRPALRPALGLLGAPLAACLFPLWRGDVLDVGYRLALAAPALAAPLALLAWPSPASARTSPVAAVAVTGLATALLAFPAARLGADPEARPPYARFRRVIAALPRPLPDLLIAHQGLSFLYDHETGHDAMAWAPEPALDRARVGRIAWGIREGEWAAYAPSPAATVVPLGAEYAYVREDVWEAFVARARRDGDDDLAERLVDWRNPSAVRPRSLARNHEPR